MVEEICQSSKTFFKKVNCRKREVNVQSLPDVGQFSVIRKEQLN
jgi:hypothetical protein